MMWTLALLLQCDPAVAPRPGGGGAEGVGRLSRLLRCLMAIGFSAGASGLESSSLVLASQSSALASGTAIMGCSPLVGKLESEQRLACERRIAGLGSNFPQMPMIPTEMSLETLPQNQIIGDTSEGMQNGFWAVQDHNQYHYDGPEYSRGRPLDRKQHHKCEHPGCRNFAG